MYAQATGQMGYVLDGEAACNCVNECESPGVISKVYRAQKDGQEVCTHVREGKVQPHESRGIRPKDAHQK